jgi:dCTP diphosphatase
MKVVPMTSPLDLESIRDQLRDFAAARDWDQFHSPRNLAAALAVEAGELLEVFQWLTDQQSQSLPEDALSRAKEEMADVLLYLIRLADKLGVDLLQASKDKIQLNEQKYPVEKARGNARKYSDL